MAFLLSGTRRSNQDMQEVLRGFAESRGAYVLTMLSDETSSEEFDEGIRGLASQMTWALKHGLSKPPTFRGK